MTAGLAVLAVAVLAVTWHAVTEHHVHLRLARLVRLPVRVPVTSHHAWWHGLPRLYRIAIQAALVLCGLAFGIAYPLAPVPVLALGGLAVAAGLGAGIRARLRADR
jgi:hypothetical protein